jgi:hypothetical protein
MSIFTKALSELSEADLQELLQERAVENVRLEFKLQAPDKDDTLKKLSSFANTFGGFMVVGAKATSADGRLEDLPGVDPIDGYKQKVVDWCFGGVSPPLIAQVSDPIEGPSDKSKVCYVIHVPESDVAPHFLNGRKGVWVRTDEFSARFEAQLADENELRHLLDRRKLVLARRANLLDRARKRFTTFATQVNTGRSGIPNELGSRLELCVVPRFPALPVCEQEKLKVLTGPATILPYRESSFPWSTRDTIFQHESLTVLSASSAGYSMVEANIWGMLFYGARVDTNESGTSGIHPYRVVGYLLMFIRHAGRVLRAIGYSGPILLETALSSILGTPWLHSQGGVVIPSRGSELDDDFTFSIATTAEELLQNPDRVAMNVLRPVFYSVNLAGLVNKLIELENLVRKGNVFNGWPADGLKL